MGIPTLIGSAHTASNASSVAITSGIDSTYDEYMFVCTDLNPATDGATFTVQFNVASASGYNETITSTFFMATHGQVDDATTFAYVAGNDQAQATGYQILTDAIGNGSDEGAAGIFSLFSPSGTTYVKHFYSRFTGHTEDNRAADAYAAGYVNATGAIDEISFKMSSGNFDGVIQMFGIS